MSRATLHQHQVDPAVAPDADQFFTVTLLDHIETCSEEDCRSDTRAAVTTTENISPTPYCTAHMHVVFADWMVGV